MTEVNFNDFFSSVAIKGTIQTNYNGYKQLLSFYNQAKLLENQEIWIDFSRLEWLDANLCALLMAFMYKLKKERSLSFTTDFVLLEKKFDVLSRNGFILNEDGVSIVDTKKTTIPCKSFLPDDKDGFIDYIQLDLMEHRSLDGVADNIKDQLQQDLIEIFANVNYHAKTLDPIFICGQMYPKEAKLILTMVDLGIGFLPAINSATQGSVKTHIEAIAWAVAGNSTKLAQERVPGGLGIKRILDYCYMHSGNFQIITGDAHWNSLQRLTNFKGFREIENPFCGTTINLQFNCN